MGIGIIPISWMSIDGMAPIRSQLPRLHGRKGVRLATLGRDDNTEALHALAE
jgi:hypothetical protein